jgi:hypothetical protein
MRMTVALHVGRGAFALDLDDPAFAIEEIGDGCLAPEGQVDAVEAARAHAGEHEGGFAQCLARERAGVGAGAAECGL